MLWRIIGGQRQQKEAAVSGHNVEAFAGEDTVGLEVIEADTERCAGKIDAPAQLLVRGACAAGYRSLVRALKHGRGRQLVRVKVGRQHLAVQLAHDATG